MAARMQVIQRSPGNCVSTLTVCSPIFTVRLSRRGKPLCADTIRAATDADLRAAGLSRQKAATVRAVAEAVADGLDLDGLAERPADEARATLEAIRGIGRWSADLYLMFCAGHPDILPVGDLAVRGEAVEGSVDAGDFHGLIILHALAAGLDGRREDGDSESAD